MTDESRRSYLTDLADKLEDTGDLSDEELKVIIDCDDEEFDEYLSRKARDIRERQFGKDVYIRGLIEFTNYCKNNCYYCGIRCGNKNAGRYRLSEDEILACCNAGYELGFRTFVLQGGEDPYYTDERFISIISKIKEKYPECALTLSVGERGKASYQSFYDAGADRYLLRHETADRDHYEKLHPSEMSFQNRINCLWDLKKIGYQVGCGMMIGSPYQKTEHLIKDIRLLQELKPEMVGIGPFIPHHDTEYKDKEAGSVKLTLRLLSLIRLILPRVLLPATTALGTVDPQGREKGILAGANVLMPNLSPTKVRDKYLLYDNKICTGDEAAECIRCLQMRISRLGYRIVQSRGDHPDF